MAKLEEDNKGIKELILKNTRNYNLGVSEMNLNITKITAMDSLGVEHFILNFPDQYSLNIKGVGYGRFYRLKKIMNLPPNTYTRLRFYLGNDNQFIFKDGVVENKSVYDYLDFEIENNLTLNAEKPSGVKIWFDMVPYELSRHFKFFSNWVNMFKNLRSSIQNT
ncbi:hypothetical protein [Aestuariivivens insulae]|uniref:hypothetical protein n=1 Tax=Aestuariivivens insulae TaxID=1621988 RepID=UPI001F579ABF|nr:hypothetical protein [Aestuariivivens insulae]